MHSSETQTPTRSLDPHSVRRARDEVIGRHGPWTAHNFRLADGVSTFEDSREDFVKIRDGHARHVRKIMQAVVDTCTRPLAELRVLDLGCLEGLYSVEFGLAGSQVVGVEGREASVAKCDLARHVLSLDNVEFVRDDVRNLSRATYGSFDVVLCLGLLYHLDAPDVFYFVSQLADVCSGLAVIETQVSFQGKATRDHGGRTYAGAYYREHADGSPREQRLQATWSSLDNPRSFWLTRPSLFNLLADSGFTSVHEVVNPAIPENFTDRDTILAIKGSAYGVRAMPAADSTPGRWPETSVGKPHQAQAALES